MKAAIATTGTGTGTGDVLHAVDDDAGPILFFDGVCNLCSASVQFIIEHERAPTLRFASLQSGLAQRLLPALGIDPTALESLVFLEGGVASTRSTAAIRLSRHLRRPWSFLPFFSWVPKFLADAMYLLVAKNRYRLFGKKESCWIPSPALRQRFIDTAAA
jgi:predicted DCC family thiol-disulfide oxidoreductase YuxK